MLALIFLLCWEKGFLCVLSFHAFSCVGYDLGCLLTATILVPPFLSPLIGFSTNFLTCFLGMACVSTISGKQHKCKSPYVGPTLVKKVRCGDMRRLNKCNFWSKYVNGFKIVPRVTTIEELWPMNVYLMKSQTKIKRPLPIVDRKGNGKNTNKQCNEIEISTVNY